jgi:hypothetical protein
VLADYVIALLKHDGDATSVRTLCEAEIPDFLTEGPSEILWDAPEIFQAQEIKRRWNADCLILASYRSKDFPRRRLPSDRVQVI